MQLHALQTAFPNKRKNKALTGLIPIEYYESHKREIRAFVKEHNLQLYFRGSRVDNALSTLKKHAHSVVIYPQADNVMNERDQLLRYAKKVDETLNVIVGILLFAIAVTIGYITFNSSETLQLTNCMQHSANQFFTALNECVNN
jgi:hypothetical protein